LYEFDLRTERHNGCALSLSWTPLCAISTFIQVVMHGTARDDSISLASMGNPTGQSC
jgi:hypothetical protein